MLLLMEMPAIGHAEISVPLLKGDSSIVTPEKDNIPKYNVNLKEVMVKATRVKIVYKGDTLVYNADAFNIPQGSMLDELIRQLPGVVLDDHGVITVNGKTVAFLTLNGNNFFKGDNKMLLDNLPSYVVKSVHVYNKSTEESEALGHDVKPKDYVMDVVLKKIYAKSYIANGDGGIGSNDRYMGKLFGLRFTNRSNLSLFGNVNNVNQNQKPGKEGNWDTSQDYKGLQSLKKVGANFSAGNKEKRYKENMDTQVSWLDDNNKNSTASESYLNNGSSFLRSRSSSEQKNVSMSVGNTFSINKPFWLSFSTRINYSKTEGVSTSNSSTFNSNPARFGGTDDILDNMFDSHSRSIPDSIITNKNFNRKSSDFNGVMIYQGIDFSKTLPWGDDISLDYNISYINSTSRSFTQYNLSYPQMQSSDYRNQYSDNHGRLYDSSLDVGYTFNFHSKWSILLAYVYRQKWNSSHQPFYRLDRLNGWGTYDSRAFGVLPSTADSLLFCLDASNSCKTSYLSRSNTAKIALIYSGKKNNTDIWFNLEIPIMLRNEHEQYQRASVDTSFRLRNLIITPKVEISATNNKYSINGSYNMDVQTPDVISMVNFRDDSNPLLVRVGNSHLRNRVDHNLYGGFQLNMSNGMLGGATSVRFVQNMIIDGYTYNHQTGIYTYRPDNVNGNWNGSLGVNYQHYIGKNKFWSVGTKNFSVDYNHLVYLAAMDGATESSLCKMDAIGFRENLFAVYQKGSLMLSFSETLDWKHSRSGTMSAGVRNIYNYDYGLILKYMLPWQIQINSDLMMHSHRGMNDSSLNTDNLICNVSLSHSFMNGKLICLFDIFDMFHQLSNTEYHVTSSCISSTWNNSIPRYVMAHIIYKINIMPKKM